MPRNNRAPGCDSADLRHIERDVKTTTQLRLQQLRDGLLNLHKTLVDSERVSYEQTFGPILSSNQFLQLLMGDPWFAWLHPISELIVSMDEVLDGKEPLTQPMADAMFKQSRLLLVASEEGDGFPKHYYEALQRDPDVVLAHADVANSLRPPKTQA